MRRHYWRGRWLLARSPPLRLAADKGLGLRTLSARERPCARVLARRRGSPIPTVLAGTTAWRRQARPARRHGRRAWPGMADRDVSSAQGGATSRSRTRKGISAPPASATGWSARRHPDGIQRGRIQGVLGDLLQGSFRQIDRADDDAAGLGDTAASASALGG